MLHLAAGGVAALAASDSWAQIPDSLAHNQIANGFKPFALDLQTVAGRLVGANGPVNMASVRGRISILSLWAEWCVPCLLEAADLAALSRRFSGERLQIVSVLTSSLKKLTYKDARALLDREGARGLPLWVEPEGGSIFLNSLATRPSLGPALPCNLLVDASGQVRGRSFGAGPAKSMSFEMKDGKLTDEAKAKLLASHATTRWGTEGPDFIEHLIRDGLPKALA